jgi:hypothetical protein
MNMLADISTGNTGFADVMFLVALVLFVIAAIVAFKPIGDINAMVLSCLGLACLALAWLVL